MAGCYFPIFSFVQGSLLNEAPAYFTSDAFLTGWDCHASRRQSRGGGVNYLVCLWYWRINGRALRIWEKNTIFTSVKKIDMVAHDELKLIEFTDYHHLT